MISDKHFGESSSESRKSQLERKIRRKQSSSARRFSERGEVSGF
jgi:hypothetical protein